MYNLFIILFFFSSMYRICYYVTKSNPYWMKVICLLCEYENSASIKNFMLNFLNEFYYNSHDEPGKNIKYLIILYCAIEFRINKSSVDSLRYCFESKPRLDSILNNCNKKLDQLKETFLCKNVTIFDILCKRFRSLTSLLNNPEILSACENLVSTLEEKKTIENHELIISTRISLAIERKKLLDSAENLLNESLSPALSKIKYSSLPYEIISNILSFLNDRDLRKMTR